MRWLARTVAIAAVILSTLAVAQAAQADTGTGNQNPDLEVTATLVNAADGGDTAMAGDRVRAAASVRNATDRRQLIRITLALTPPGGETLRLSYPFLIGAQRTASVSLTLPILRFVPPGEYTLGVSASNANGTSSADASITIVE
jgi:hypothetical protein